MSSIGNTDKQLFIRKIKDKRLKTKVNDCKTAGPQDCKTNTVKIIKN